jgi:hypothetical protein
MQLIDRLGLDTNGATAVEIIGVGGQASGGYLLELQYQLGPHRWHGPAIFSEAVSSNMILGQAGFFQFFNVTFRRHVSEMDIRRVRATRSF